MIVPERLGLELDGTEKYDILHLQSCYFTNMGLVDVEINPDLGSLAFLSRHNKKPVQPVTLKRHESVHLDNFCIIPTTADGSEINAVIQPDKKSFNEFKKKLKRMD